MITRRDAIELFHSGDLIRIGMEADALRKRLHPENIVTFCICAPADSPAPDVVVLNCTPGEPVELRVDKLEVLRLARDQAGLLHSCLVRFASDGEEVTAAEYLKTLSIARLYLESIPDFQIPLSFGLKLCQIALRFGANELRVDPGTRPEVTEEQLRCLIRDAGFIPRQRDVNCHAYLLS